MFVPYHQQKLFDNQYVAGATSIILLFIVIRPLTASIIDIVPSAVNQEKQLVN
jgi:hypothetical protein